MKKILLNIMLICGLCLGVGTMNVVPVFAVSSCGENGVDTNLFGCVEDDGDGCGVYSILNLILTILTWGVGIAATAGLVISAIMYLTARDNESQVAKAKTRILEIVIGLALFAMMWAALQWLIPGGILNTGNIC